MLEIFTLSDAAEHLLRKQVVIFDLDDTLYSEKDYVRSGFYEVARQNTAIKNMAEKLWSAFENGEKAIDFVLKTEGIYSAEKAAECIEIYRNHSPNITPYPEAERLLQNLKKAGVRLGMITDGRVYGQRAKIAALGIGKYFEKMIVTDELGGVAFRKPNSKAYEIMQSYFCVPYQQMVYVGDNLNKDFLAPEKLGMDCVLFKNPDGLYLQS